MIGTGPDAGPCLGGRWCDIRPIGHLAVVADQQHLPRHWRPHAADHPDTQHGGTRLRHCVPDSRRSFRSLSAVWVKHEAQRLILQRDNFS